MGEHNRGMAFKCIALKVFMTLPCLLLQNPSWKSEAKNHLKKLGKRLKLWNKGNIGEIIEEARTIQNRFGNSTNSRRTHEDSARSFAKLMWRGKLNGALKMLGKDYDNAVFKLDKKVPEKLKLKHPAPAEVKGNSPIHGSINKVPNWHFNDIMVGRVASLTKDSSDPSQLDSNHFRHMILS